MKGGYKMRKILKKKVRIFEKEVSVFLIAIVAMIGLTSAALVPYISGLITGTVSVEQPFTLTLEDGTDTFAVGPLSAFENITQTFNLTNNAGVPIEAIVESNISGETTDFSSTVGEEFEHFWIGLKDGVINQAACEADGGVWEVEGIAGYCYWDASFDEPFTGVIDGDYFVQMGSKASPAAIPAGAEIQGRLNFKFKTNVAPDTYTMEIAAVTPEAAQDLA